MQPSTYEWAPFTLHPSPDEDTSGHVRFQQPPDLPPLKEKYVALLLNAGTYSDDLLAKECKRVAMSAFGNKWPHEDVRRLLLESPGFGPMLQRVGNANLEDLIRVSRAAATPERIADHVDDLRHRLEEARGLSQSIRWPRIPGLSVDNSATTKVLLAVLAMADKAATSTGLHLSVRRVGLESGTNRSVASRAIRRLHLVGVLTPSAKNDAGPSWHAKGYNLNLEVLGGLITHDAASFDGTLAEYVHHDAFRRGALSPISLRILAALSCQDGLKEADVAKRVGVSKGWAKTKLNQLALYRLVTRRESGWTRCPNEALSDRLNEAASYCGKLGEGARQSFIYMNERDHFRCLNVSPSTKVDRDTGEVLRS